MKNTTIRITIDTPSEDSNGIPLVGHHELEINCDFNDWNVLKQGYDSGAPGWETITLKVKNPVEVES